MKRPHLSAVWLFQLCEQLEEDPAKVARIIIEPGVVTVEHEYPIQRGDA